MIGYIRKMLKEMASVINSTNFKIPDDCMQEFKEESVRRNINRLYKICNILILLMIVMFIVHMYQFREMWEQSAAYRRICISYIAFLPVLFMYTAILAKCHKSREVNIKQLQFISYSIIILVELWCIFLSVNAQLIHGEIYEYLIATFYISSLMIWNIKEFGVFYIISYTLFLIGLVILQNDMVALSRNILNSLFVTVVAIIGSGITYSHYASEFVNKKAIAEKNSELESSKRHLEDEVKRRTEELVRANEEMQYEKLRTEFFANVSHELRTPLNVIFCAEQLIEYSVKNPDPEGSLRIDKYVSTIKQNCYRLIRLISNLIDITKMDAGNFEILEGNYEIVKVVEDITLSVAEYIENKNIDLIFDTEVEERVIACDPDKIERIILNLLSNSVKFTGAGGRIDVKMELKEDNIEISVKDTGTGIPLEKQDNIFERFVQVDKSISRMREGSGIGLSLVKSLVEMHGGTIKLRSVYGKGSEFIIRLPDKVLDYKEDKREPEQPLKHDKVERISIEFSDIYM
ncbi:MAG: HAMP domain-containing sensor histidine kinase [Bacillota bacterium]|nr:HAMP domain-containing sensor histidine kinase [Bacillota bacterium]